MARRDPRVTAYIGRAAPFARPILRHLRAVVHEACPEVEEALKWGMPAFLHHGLLCGMAAFKAHATFGLWRSQEVLGVQGDRDAMGSYGRITAVADLPARRTLLAQVRKAATVNEAGPRRVAPRRRKPAPVTPPDLRAALSRNARAKAAWERFPPGHRREYIEWITEAKQPETRARRLATTVAWVAQGKGRNWKYQR